MKDSKKSLSRILISYSILTTIVVASFFTTQILTEQRKQDQIYKLQDKIALVNNCVNTIQELEQNFQSYVLSGEGEYVQRASENAGDVRATIIDHPDIFQQEDQIIIFSHSIEQITEAIDTLLSEKIYNKLDKEESFNTIKLAELGFEYLTRATFSLIANYMAYTSVQIEKIYTSYSNINTIQQVVFLLVLFVTLFSFLRIISSTRMVLSLLTHASEKLTEDQVDFEDLPDNEYMEMDIAGKAFNKMKKNIRMNMDALEERLYLKELLAEKTLESEKQLRLIQETKFNLLQAQINPHFLFNTLNMITNSVRKGDRNEETADILVATSRLLRDTIEITVNLISLEKELKLLNNYLMIQKERNKGRIEFITEIEDDLPYVQIPPFSLQPLVENSIIHGLKDTIVNGRITISVFNDDDDGVMISIHDNGMGMSKETMDKALLVQLESNGLGNVIKRLKFQYYNDDIVLFSKGRVGTTINIHLDNNFVKKGEVNA